MAKVYYVGDWAVMLGPVFAETPFNYAFKGTNVVNYGHWLKSALESDVRHQVTSVPTWEFYELEPGAWETILADYDVVIFSDVEAKNFQLAPAFFDRSRFGKEPLTFPDRVRLTVEALHTGTHMMFLGGWLSFNGETGKGGWGRTRLAEILPCRCLEVEDLRESTEGFVPQPAQPGRPGASAHPILAGIDTSSMPPILGYNKVEPRDGCEVVLQWPEGDPALTTGTFGGGRVIAYTSDPAPHWGCNFVYWDGYARFWSNALEWLLTGS
jgi:uncharacterized membrane protein